MLELAQTTRYKKHLICYLDVIRLGPTTYIPNLSGNSILKYWINCVPKPAYLNTLDTIVALSTAQGVSAIAVIRLSGKDSIDIVQQLFEGKILSEQPSHTLHLGLLKDHDEVLDEVVVSIFREPNSFTKENSIEISCHGSPIIVQRIIRTLLKHGTRLASPGEFTKRAFLNGRFDLAQAEAVADLINAETDNARQAALNQMRGGFSKEIKKLREELIHFASLIELELDFGEEDVEFAKREDLRKLIFSIQVFITTLMDSFEQGNVIKNGVPTVIQRLRPGSGSLCAALLSRAAEITDPPWLWPTRQQLSLTASS